MNFKLVRQLRWAGIALEIIGLFGYMSLFWLGFFLFVGSYCWSVGILEDYFISLSKENEEKEQTEENQD